MFIFITQTHLASRNRLLRIITASQVDCLSCIWMLENFLWIIWTILSISFGVIGLVRLCSLNKFITWVVNSLHACKKEIIKNRLFLLQSRWNESSFLDIQREERSSRLNACPDIESRWKTSLTFRGKNETARRKRRKGLEEAGWESGEREEKGRRSRKKRDERRVRIMHYSWWLLDLREKGLCSISVFETSTLPSEGSEERTQASVR